MGKFSVAASCPPNKKPKIIKVAAVQPGGWTPPPADVAPRLGGGGDFLFGVDIETHHFTKRRGGTADRDEFGHYSLCRPVDLEARVVQLGWSFGPAGGAATVRTRMVKPRGFQVSQIATDVHKITHQQAETEGMDLEMVLQEFTDDLFHHAAAHGARLVSHHLAFDAGILSREMARCHMQETRLRFAAIVKKGLCTMDPHIGRWLRGCWGEDTGTEESMHTMKLQDLVQKLLPEAHDLLARLHDAGVDALLHRKLGYAIYGLSRAPCRLSRRGGGDTHRKQPLAGQPEIEECSLCGERF